MNVRKHAILMSCAICGLVFVASIALTFAFDKYAIMRPYNALTWDLTDPAGDVANGSYDIVRYGSYQNGDVLVLFIVTREPIQLSGNGDYHFAIVGKMPGDETGSIVALFLDLQAMKTSGNQYVCNIGVNGTRLEIYFPMQYFSEYLSNWYMTGVEVSAQYGYNGTNYGDYTALARDNPLLTRFLGIF